MIDSRNRNTGIYLGGVVAYNIVYPILVKRICISLVVPYEELQARDSFDSVLTGTFINPALRTTTRPSFVAVRCSKSQLTLFTCLILSIWISVSLQRLNRQTHFVSSRFNLFRLAPIQTVRLRQYNR